MSKIAQLGGVILDTPIFVNLLSSVAKKPYIARNIGTNFLNKPIDRFKKEYVTNSGKL